MLTITPSRDELIELTASWPGERFDDGRPRVPDVVLDRLRTATNEQAWKVLHDEGYPPQFAGGWRRTQAEVVLVGRAVTSVFLPHRPDYDATIRRAAAHAGYADVERDKENAWVVETLQSGDVMVTDIFGKIVEGTVIGDNLGTAVAARTGAGAVIDGGIRDFDGLTQLRDVNFFFRDVDPTPIRDVTLAGINTPTRIGRATVLPGDIVLGTPSGVTFIPAQLAEKVADVSAETHARDTFGKQRLAEQVYTAEEIDIPVWPHHVEEDFRRWTAANQA